MTAETSFGKLIKRRRAALGMSQAALADLVGRSASAIRTWERGASTPTDEGVVRSLAAVLGIDESELRMTVGMPGEIRSEEAEEIGGRGLVEFTEERSPTEARPSATFTGAPGESDDAVDSAGEISWDDVAASVVRHTEPSPPAPPTAADISSVDNIEQVAPADDVDEAKLEDTARQAMVTEEAAQDKPAAPAEPESGVVPVAAKGEPDATAGEPEPVVEMDEERADAGEPQTQAELDAAGDRDDAVRVGESEDVAPEPDAPESVAAPEPETVSVETPDRPTSPAPEPLAPAATTATRTTLMPVREPAAPPAAGSYLDDPDQMITYWIRAAMTVALVMFLLVVLFWALGKLGDSIGEVWALFKAGS